MESKPKPKRKSVKKSHVSQQEVSGLADAIVRSVGAGIYIVQHGRFVYVSSRFRELTGYTEKELLGAYSIEHVHPDDKEMVRDMAIRSLKGGSTRPYEYRYLRKNGDVLWVMEMVSSTEYQDERATLGIFMDITERRLAEESYRTVVRTTSDGFWMSDLEGNFLDVNDAYCNLIGYSRDELLNMRVQDIEASETPDAVAERILKLKEIGHARFESRHRRKDGDIVDVEVSISYLPIRQGAMFVFVRDITERKQADEALELRAQLLDSATDSIFVHDGKGNYIYVNETACRFHGYSREEFMKLKVQDIVAPERVGGLKSDFQRMLEKEEIIVESSHRRKDGSVVPMEIHGRTIEIGGRTVILTVGRDITERKQVEEALELRAQLLDSATDSIYVHDFEGNFVYVNEAACRFHGYSREEFMKLKVQDIVAPERVGGLQSEFQEMLEKGRAVFEHTNQLKDGSVISIEIHGRTIELGGRTLFITVGRDITERKQMEEALRQSEERYRSVLDEMDEAYFEADLAGNFTFINDAQARILGYSVKELIGMNNRVYTPEEDIEALYKDYQAVYKTGKPVTGLLHRIIRKDGTIRFTEVSAAPMRNKEGKIIGFHGVAHDVTERKQMEEALRQSEERYRSILDEIEEGYFETDIAGKFTFVNDSLSRIWGYSQEELIGMDYRVYTAKDKAEALYKAYNKVYRTGKPARNIPQDLIRKDGTPRFVEISASPLRSEGGEIIGFRGVARDVTESKKMEYALRESEARFRAVFEQSPMGIGIVDSQTGRIVVSNQKAADITGRTVEEIQQLDFQSHTHPDDLQQDMENMEQLLSGEKRFFNVEKRYVRSDGSVCWANVTFVPLWAPGEAPTFHMTMMEDITERKIVEDALKESEEMYRFLVEMSPDMIVVNVGGRIAFINSAGLRLLGASDQKDIVGRRGLDFVHPDYHEIYDERLREALEEGKVTPPMEEKRIRLDGTIVDVEATSVPIVYKGRPARQSVVRDITWRKQSEEKLRFLATHDPLTGLPNRTLFTDRMMVALAQAERHQHQIAVMMLDLDRFKYVNDILGHDMGDKLLVEVGNRLTDVLRKSDTVARMGGDEFVILLPQMAQAEYATGVAQKILRAFHIPFAFDGRDLNITTSIGITVYPEDGGDTAELLKNADVAMYRAKERGRDNYQLFSDIPSPT